MGSLSNFDGAREPEKVTRARDSLCPTCGQPVPEGGPAAAPAFEAPESVRVLSERIHGQLRERFPDFKYHIWLRPLRLLWRQGEHLTFAAPEHVRTSFEARYLAVVIGLLREAGWKNVTGEVVREDWQPSAEQLAAGPSCEPRTSAAAPTGDSYLQSEEMADSMADLMAHSGIRKPPEEPPPAAAAPERAPRRRRRSDVPG